MMRSDGWLVFIVLLFPGLSEAMEATCRGCSDTCCQWAFAAQLALANGEPSIESYSKETFEEYGYERVPCREVLGDERAYYRCAVKAFERCQKRLCCQFRPQLGLGWSWGDFFGVGKFPGYPELSAQLERERLDEQWEEREQSGISGTKPVRLYPGQVIVV